LSTIRRSEVASETPLAALLRPLTPNDAFFVRHHARQVPRIGAGEYRLEVEGARGARVLGLDDVRALPRVARTMTLACAGNGRSGFDPVPGGVRWGIGAISTAQWDGVRLRDLLASAGIPDDARHVVFDAYDRASENGKPPYRRSIPLARALDDGTILADTMNGEPLPAEHGGPLRVLVGGWTANHSVKWLRRITFAARPDEGWWMTGDYRYPDASGVLQVIETAAPVAIVASPQAGPVRSGEVELQGVAYGTPSPSGVRVEIDGAHAGDAVVRYDDGPYAWGRWSKRVSVGSGAHRIAVRPVDAAGSPGPSRGTWNEKGYLYDGPHTIEVVAS
jgi:DMSO/TMAO reductase YedYZ molybdopterin-dependent catalytic subunit